MVRNRTSPPTTFAICAKSDWTPTTTTKTKGGTSSTLARCDSQKAWQLKLAKVEQHQVILCMQRVLSMCTLLAWKRLRSWASHKLRAKRKRPSNQR